MTRVRTSPQSQLDQGLYFGLNTLSYPFWGSPIIQNQDGTLSCPGFYGNTYATNAWDKVLIGVPYDQSKGEQPYTPGICTVEVMKGRGVDKKKSAGKDGTTVTFQGIENADVRIDVMIWTPEQLRQFVSLWSLLCPKLGKSAPNPYDVQHPTLTLHDVKSLQFIRGSGPVPGPIAKSRIFTMYAVEFIQKQTKNVVRTPIQSMDSIFNVTANPKPSSVPANFAP